MKKLTTNQTGIAHLVPVIILLLIFVAIAGFAYTRISDEKPTTENSQSTSQEDDTTSVDDEEQTDEALNEEETSENEDNEATTAQ